MNPPKATDAAAPTAAAKTPRTRAVKPTLKQSPLLPADDPQLALSFEGVGYAYGEHAALRHLTLQLKRGEVLALLGPNGAGKSTAVKLALGFLAPDFGTLTVLGTSPEEARAHVGYIPESVSLYPSLTGFENLSYFHALTGSPPDDPFLHQCLAAAGLDQAFADRPAGTYSKGMRQKVGVAIALAKKAKVLILDEPSSGLDPAASRELHRRLRALSMAGVGVLMVTHDLFRAREVADRIVVLREGQVVSELNRAEAEKVDLDLLYHQLMAA